MLPMVVCAAAMCQNSSLQALTKLFTTGDWHTCGDGGKGYVDHATVVAGILVRSVTGISVLDSWSSWGRQRSIS